MGVLKKILHEARQARESDQRFLAVFDLDSTLFDLKERQRRIVLSFAQNSKSKSIWPNQCMLLEQMQLLPGDFGIGAGLRRLGFDEKKDPEFLHALMKYWQLWFFHNDFLEHDTPLPGSVEFVRALESLDADIMYLTGRDLPRMHKGTLRSLKAFGFPVDEDHTLLYLKPEASLDDALFKVNAMKKAERSYHRVWLFENEPVNLNLIAKTCPSVNLVFLETCHSGREQLHEELDTIPHFEVELDEFKRFFKP